MRISSVPALLLGLCLLQACLSSQSGQKGVVVYVNGVSIPENTWPVGRLPREVQPLSYKLALDVVPSKPRFEGRARIRVKLTRPLRRLFIHGAGLTVTRVRATFADGERHGEYRQLNGDGLAVIVFDAPLSVGEAELSFDYNAPFDTSLKGLYRVEHGGADYAFTQFEPYSARAAFPCFDEPSFKTPFELTLTVPKGLTAIANTSPASSEVVKAAEPAASADDGEQGDAAQAPTEFEQTVFTKTEPLPTYLVALAVGPFDVVEGTAIAPNDLRKEPLPFRAIAPRGQGERLTYALEHTPLMVEALERYFAIGYPYDKLDIIAVPDFAAGAMENAGAITFRDYLLLLDPVEAPESQKRAFAYVMAHELAHQWFGNLVTMPWWDDLWLNEAFATWMGNAVIDELWPEQQAHMSLLNAAQRAMDEDSLSSARMIRQPIETTHDIASAFDAITYSKGGGVLSMFERFVGPEVFREGIRQYMQAHKFGNATAADLLQALSNASGQELQAPFDTFLTQTGVPLVSAELTCPKQGKGATVALRQERYLPVGSQASTDRQWQIPVCLRYGPKRGKGEGQTECLLLKEKQQVVELPHCPAWVMPNADAGGYYLWTLGEKDLAALQKKGFSAMGVREQVAFAKAVGAAFGSADLSVDQVLAALGPLAASPERAVARAPLAVLTFLYEHGVEPSEREALRAYACDLYRPTIDRLGIAQRADEGGEERLLRTEVLAFMADIAQDGEVYKRLLAMGRKALSAPEAAHPGVAADVVSLAVRIAVSEGDNAVYDQVYKLFVDEADPIRRTRWLRALGNVRDERSQRSLALSLDKTVRVNEVLSLLAMQFAHEQTREKAWEFVVENYDALAERASPRRLGQLPLITTSFCSAGHAKRLEAFFGPKAGHLPGGPRSLAQALEAIAICEAQVKAHRGAATAHFAALSAAKEAAVEGEAAMTTETTGAEQGADNVQPEAEPKSEEAQAPAAAE